MNSSYDLSLQEQKLILTLASMVQPGLSNPITVFDSI
ncbi:hypothetical protein [Haloimpatiens lingqiaonensis]